MRQRPGKPQGNPSSRQSSSVSSQGHNPPKKPPRAASFMPKRNVSSDAMTARHLCRANNSSATPHKAGRSKQGLVATLSTELVKMEALFYNLPIALTRPTGNKKGLHSVQSFLSAYGGDARIRTGGKGFAGLCLTTWPRRRLKKPTVNNRIGLRNQMERTTGFEPATPTLARLCSTS